jgi:ABC-type nitrate/sulfonate/bicarbonate transport system substrate-binding protein
MTRRTLGFLALAAGIAARGLLPADAAAQQATKVTYAWGRAAPNGVAFRLPEFAKPVGLEVDQKIVATGVDLVTGLVSGRFDTVLVTEQHLIQGIDKNLDFVSVVGNARGGSRIVAATSLDLKPGDFKGLKALIETWKRQGKKFRVAASRGSVNEALCRLEFEHFGIDTEKDIEIVNIPRFEDHPQALQSGSVQMVFAWEPAGTVAAITGYGRTFAYPYDHPAGALNTLWLTTRRFESANPLLVQKFVDAVYLTADFLKGNPAVKLKDVVEFTGLNEDIAREALRNSWLELKPDVKAAQTLAKLNAKLAWTARDVSDDLPKHMEMKYLAAAEARRKKPGK